MNERTTAGQLVLDCSAADELGAAYAVGALDPIERIAVEEHLAGCRKPHAELRGMLGADEVLAASVEPVPPSPVLRERIMATIDTTPQEGAGAAQAAPREVAPKEGWTDRWFRWLSLPLARGLVAVAVVLVIALGAWNVSLQGSLASRDKRLQAVAAAIGAGQAAFRASGSVGSGYVVEDGSNRANLIVANLAPLEANRIYELWLVGADNIPVAVGTFGGSTEPVAVVPLERGLGGFTTFAITVESQRVSSPTSKPVLVASLGG